MKKLKYCLFLSFLFSSTFSNAAANTVNHKLLKKPRLVLTIVYDQFRADMLTRFPEKFLPAIQKNGKPGGFRYLMEKGAYFPFAEYEVFQCMTCPGHAMILTGSYPYSNGISLNEWYDPNKKKKVYCAFDEEFGLSPRNLNGSTVGDELKMHSIQSKVVAIALKDRSAIMLGGKTADAVVWLNSDSLQWESSAYYKNRLSLDWLNEVNQRIGVLKDTEVQWKPSLISTQFSYKAKATSGDALGFPLGIKLTNEIALQAIKKLKLGQGSSTDLLAVSFSTHDISGHRFGPHSPEMEELTLQEDRLLAEFLEKIQQQIPGGLSDVLITLTADHGVAPTAGFAKSKGLDAGEINADQILDGLNKEVTKALGEKKPIQWFDASRSLNFYLAESIKESDRKNQILKIAKTWLLQQEGVAFAFTSEDYDKRTLPPEMHEKQILKSYIPGINGDLVLIPKPFWYEKGKMLAMHMTGYSYDRSVPLIFVGTAIKPGLYSSPAKVVDLAPTLSFILGQLPPALSEGKVLSSILKTKE